MADLMDSDVKPTTESSAVSGGIEDSPTSPEVDANAGTTMLDAVRKAVKSSDAPDEAKDDEAEGAESEESSTEDQKPEKEKESSSSVELDKKEEGEPKSEDEEESSDKKEEEEQGPVPYERFQEVNEKANQAEARVKEYEPIVKHHNDIVTYCQKFNISQTQFSEGLEILGLINTDPAEALKKLSKHVEELQGFTGDRLPEDLQKRVDNGRLDLADARELAQGRAQAKFGQRSYQQYQQMRQQEQQVRMQSEFVKATQAWVNSKKSDPDFREKAKPDAPDGKFERVFDKISALVSATGADGRPTNVADTPQKMTALMERAYQEVTKSIGASGKRPPTRKPLLHGGSSKNGKQYTVETAPTLKEAVNIYLGKD